MKRKQGGRCSKPEKPHQVITTINFRLRDQTLQHLQHDEIYAKVNLALNKDPQDPKYLEFSVEDDGLLKYHHKTYVPNNSKL